VAWRRGQQVSDTTTTESVAAPAAETVRTVVGSSFDEQVAKDLMARARQEGVSLVGPGGLLAGLTKTVLETALEAEMTDHLGYEKHAPAGRNSGNSRNGARVKKVVTEVGPVEVEVPRDRDGTFEPKIVPKRARRLGGVDEMVISLVAKGLTTGEVQAHLAEVYGASVSRETISKITDSVLETMAQWQSRPLDRVYPVLFIDAIFVKVRDGQVANRPIYVAIGVTVDGERDIVGLWAGRGGEGAKFWLQVLTEIKNRGTEDVCIVVCDGLTGLPDAIEATWRQAITQTCVLHLLRNSFRYASKRYWPAIAKDLKPIYTAPTADAAWDRLTEFAAVWEDRYPAIIKLWESAWSEFIPFLAFPVEIRTILYSTDDIVNVSWRCVSVASGPRRLRRRVRRERLSLSPGRVVP
jgi:putative transposase